MDFDDFVKTTPDVAKMLNQFLPIPKLAIAKHRMNKMFINKCEAEISDYEKCLDDFEW
jgi:hypothetical protein